MSKIKKISGRIFVWIVVHDWDNLYFNISYPKSELESGSGFSGRVGFGSGSGSNFVCNFFKFNDLILFFERLYLQ